MEMPKDLTEVTLRRKDVYDGKILKVHVDDVRLPNGREAVREVVDHVDGAAVLAMGLAAWLGPRLEEEKLQKGAIVLFLLGGVSIIVKSVVFHT